jgi:hypothetical protein
MRQMSRMFFGVIAAILLQAGMVGSALAQGAQPAAGQGGGEGYVGGGQEAAGPQGASRPLDMPILYVTGIEVLRTAMDPKVDVIHVMGLVSSLGWSTPQLVPFFYGKPSDDVLDLQFIATSPQQSQKAEGFVPVTAMFTLEAGHPYKGVRVRAGANALAIKQIPAPPRQPSRSRTARNASARNSPKRARRRPAPPMSCARKTCRTAFARSRRRTALPASCITRTASTWCSATTTQS